jgi:hypothetical protein
MCAYYVDEKRVLQKRLRTIKLLDFVNVITSEAMPILDYGMPCQVIQIDKSNPDGWAYYCWNKNKKEGCFLFKHQIQ